MKTSPISHQIAVNTRFIGNIVKETFLHPTQNSVISRETGDVLSRSKEKIQQTPFLERLKAVITGLFRS